MNQSQLTLQPNMINIYSRIMTAGQNTLDLYLKLITKMKCNKTLMMMTDQMEVGIQVYVNRMMDLIRKRLLKYWKVQLLN